LTFIGVINVPLAIFDLDNTLLGGDSDHAWGDWLCERGILDGVTYKARNDAFYEDYLAGRLDIKAYHDFSLEILGRYDRAQLDEWHLEFMRECIEPIVLKKGEALVAKHRDAGDQLMIITATNRFVTAPIAKRLGIDTLLATECEESDGRYTGRSADIPCFKEGKVTRLNRWLEETRTSLAGSYFYSDSRNDLPLLEKVEHPFAVDPDDALRAEAQKRGWPIISLRD
jgi:HAD superfamily hydrolase (TIGR01490 family)